MTCRTEASGISGKPGDEAAVASGAKRRRMEPPRLTKEEEEVVSNMVRVAPADSSAGGGTLQVCAACCMQSELHTCPALDGCQAINHVFITAIMRACVRLSIFRSFCIIHGPVRASRQLSPW